MHTTDGLATAEVVLRRYARLTNRSLAGRRFGVAGSGPDADALAGVLIAIGAIVRRVPAGSTDPGADVTFDATTDHAACIQPPVPARVTAGERIDFARRHMSVVTASADRLARSKLLNGRRVGVCLALEPKTAVLVLELARAGAQVSVYGHSEETDAAVAAELRARGVTVFADPDPVRSDELADAFLAQRLHLLVDDGSHLIRRLLDHPQWTGDLVGAAEETTSGLRPLRARQLPFPVVAVNDAGSKVCFDNAHGTGQSCLFTVLDLVAPDGAWPLASRSVVVAGFGPVGEGFARHARALGARVGVADPDPVAALRARFAGHETGTLIDLAGDADLVVSASGHPHTITPEVLAAARPGAVVAVAGGVEDEVDWRAVVAAGGSLHQVAEKVEDLVVPDGGSVRLLDRGGCINVTAGEGNPIEIMDLSFGVQLVALELLVTTPLPPGVQALPAAADRAVSALALDAANRGRA